MKRARLKTTAWPPLDSLKFWSARGSYRHVSMAGLLVAGGAQCVRMCPNGANVFPPPRFAAHTDSLVRGTCVITNNLFLPNSNSCAIRLLTTGVRGVVIIDGRKPHSILFELFSDKGFGTLIRK